MSSNALPPLTDWQRRMLDAFADGAIPHVEHVAQRGGKALVIDIGTEMARRAGQHTHYVAGDGLYGINCPPDCPPLRPWPGPSEEAVRLLDEWESWKRDGAIVAELAWLRAKDRAEVGDA